jgi:hypothetical protein
MNRMGLRSRRRRPFPRDAVRSPRFVASVSHREIEGGPSEGRSGANPGVTDFPHYRRPTIGAPLSQRDSDAIRFIH